MPQLDPQVASQTGPDVGWYPTLAKYAPAAAALAVGVLLGRPGMRAIARKVAPEATAAVEASRIPFALRETSHSRLAGGVTPTTLTAKEAAEFAANPLSHAFHRSDPAMEIAIHGTVPNRFSDALAEITQPGRTKHAPAHALGHEMEHAQAVARAAESYTAPMSRGAYYDFTNYAPLLKSPELPRLLQTMTKEYPDLYGMYWVYRKAGDKPAESISELITEYINRSNLIKFPGVTAQHLMNFDTREAAVAHWGRPAERAFAELDEIMAGTTAPRWKKHHPGERTISVPTPLDALRNWQAVTAARAGRRPPPPPRINFNEFER